MAQGLREFPLEATTLDFRDHLDIITPTENRFTQFRTHDNLWYYLII